MLLNCLTMMFTSSRHQGQLGSPRNLHGLCEGGISPASMSRKSSILWPAISGRIWIPQMTMALFQGGTSSKALHFWI